MRKTGSLAKTALAANVLVWGGAALFLFALAGESTYAAFHGQWYNILGWALIVAVGLAVAVVGAVQVQRLHRRLPARQATPAPSLVSREFVRFIHQG